MTCDDFYMDVKTETVSIEGKDGNMHMSAEILIDDFTFALLKTNDNLDMIAKPIKDELIKRAENEWDLSTITDDDLAKFKKVLEWIL